MKRKSKNDDKDLPCWLCAIIITITIFVWSVLIYEGWLTPTL